MKATKVITETAGDNLYIVVLTQGFVFLGNYHPAKDGAHAFIDNAKNIRTFGTTAGLGEIALNGPTKETVLDDCGIVVLDNPQALVYRIKCVF